MNRVVLCGRLCGPPQISYAACGMAIATFRLAVPRHDRDPGSAPTSGHPNASDEIDCLAFGTLAIELSIWGEDEVRLHLEGRIRSGCASAQEKTGVGPVRVHVDHGYCADPIPTASAVFLRVVTVTGMALAPAERAA
ncbi:MAG: single-stranded DNA-binding protein [Armatimonadota bacterium]